MIHEKQKSPLNKEEKKDNNIFNFFFNKKSSSSDEKNDKEKEKPTKEEQKDNSEEKKELPTIPTFDEFINLSYEEFGVNCNNVISKFFANNIYLCTLKIFSKNKFNLEIKVQKKLPDFERLYKLISSKYSNMNFEQFPSFSFLVKDEEYMTYFDNLLNTIIRTAKDNEEMKIIFLKFIYDFFFTDQNKELVSPISSEIIKNMFSKDHSKVLKTPKKKTKHKSKL